MGIRKWLDMRRFNIDKKDVRIYVDKLKDLIKKEISKQVEEKKQEIQDKVKV
jgi:uracil phosphoribosyltransferase